jgi:hypothetical protein
MTRDEALKLALDALERSVATCLDPYSHEQVRSRPEHFINQAITALRLAIDVENMASKSTYKEQLETQRTWVGLTPQERDEIQEQVYGAVPHHVAFHHAIEAKLKEKNT